MLKRDEIEMLILDYKNGNESSLELIIKDMDNYCYKIASSYNCPDMDIEDLKQYAFMGIYRGIKNYNTSLNNRNCISFLQMCASRAIKTAIKSSLRQKHYHLNNAISENTVIGHSSNGENLYLIDTLSNKNYHLDDSLMEKEFLKRFNNECLKLSDIRRKVLKLYIQGYQQKEICDMLGLNNTKQVDNALQGAKKQLRVILST